MQLQGKVGKILFQSKKNYFATFLLHTEGGTKTVVGYFPFMYQSLHLTLHGRKKIHKRFGEQFEATSFDILEPQSKRELIDFLVSDIVSCDKLLAVQIAQKMGLSYLNMYNDLKACLRHVPNTERNMQILEHNKYQLDSFYQKKNVLNALVKLGFSQETSSKIAFSEHPPAVSDIQEDPYLLIKRYQLEWREVDAIAQKNGIHRHSRTRVHAGIYYLVDAAANEKGHMYLPHEMLSEMAQEFLGTTFDLEEQIKEMEAAGKIIRDVRDHVYSEDNYHSERRLAENLYRLHLAEPTVKQHPFVFKSSSFPYSPDQQEAITMAINEPVSIISGPAGTGKTTVLVKIVEELSKIGYTIKLCAPTGRAAKRMSDVTKRKASTLHLMLKFSNHMNMPLYNKEMPLEGTCFIVDEVSMVDIKMMSYLLDAIRSGAKLILLGDVHQLPSIGPGRLLSDLLSYGEFPCKELTTVFRQEGNSAILDMATKIRNGEHVDLAAISSSEDFKFYSMKNAYDIKAVIQQIVDRFVRNGQYNLFTDLQVISPIHNGPIGVKELNAVIQETVNPHGLEIVAGTKVFRLNDKVIQLVNNPDKEVVNGDIGQIISVDKKSRALIVEFYGERIEYTSEELFELDLGYVSTVHKVQGGECPFVIMPFHSSFGTYMVNRKLLYTAVTRAKQFLIMLGDPETVNHAIDQDELDERYCNIHSRLKAARLQTVFD